MRWPEEAPNLRHLRLRAQLKEAQGNEGFIHPGNILIFSMARFGIDRIGFRSWNSYISKLGTHRACVACGNRNPTDVLQGSGGLRHCPRAAVGNPPSPPSTRWLCSSSAGWFLSFFWIKGSSVCSSAVSHSRSDFSCRKRTHIIQLVLHFPKSDANEGESLRTATFCNLWAQASQCLHHRGNGQVMGDGLHQKLQH